MIPAVFIPGLLLAFAPSHEPMRAFDDAGAARGWGEPAALPVPEYRSEHRPEAPRIGRARLSLLRADGMELAWIEGTVAVPVDEINVAWPLTIDFEPPENSAYDRDDFASDWPDPSGSQDVLRLIIDRSTALRDGGISGSRGAITQDGVMRLSSIASGEGEYDIYDLAFAWDAFTPGPLTVSLTGGLKAIDARIGKVIDDGGVPTFQDARGMVAVPVIGGGLSWQLDDNIALTGSAMTQSFSGQGSVLDMSAETSIRLAPNIGLSAGYQFIRSAIQVQSLGTELQRQGVYARIRIEF